MESKGKPITNYILSITKFFRKFSTIYLLKRTWKGFYTTSHVIVYNTMLLIVLFGFCDFVFGDKNETERSFFKVIESNHKA